MHFRLPMKKCSSPLIISVFRFSQSNGRIENNPFQCYLISWFFQRVRIQTVVVAIVPTSLTQEFLLMATTINHALDISTEAQVVLETVQKLENRYGTGYVIDVLRGETRFGLRDEGHQHLATYGKLQGSSGDYLRRLLKLLVKEGYLFISNPRFGTIGISAQGEAYLKEPTVLGVSRQAMNESAFVRELRKRLKVIRKELSEREQKPAFRIFTNHCLEEMIQAKPSSLSTLMDIPGIGHYKANKYGPAILACLEEVEGQMVDYYHEQRLRKAGTPSHQAVKAMFETGLSVAEIAERRKVKASTITQTLDTLHRTGQIDLKPWIERSIPADDFEKGTKWFEGKTTPRLKMAYEELGLDYDTLRLCKLYVSDFSTSETEFAQAS